MQQNLKEINPDQIINIIDTLSDTYGLLSDDILTLMENICLFLKEIDSLLNDGRKKLEITMFEDLVSIIV